MAASAQRRCSVPPCAACLLGSVTVTETQQPLPLHHTDLPPSRAPGPCQSLLIAQHRPRNLHTHNKLLRLLHRNRFISNHRQYLQLLRTDLPYLMRHRWRLQTRSHQEFISDPTEMQTITKVKRQSAELLKLFSCLMSPGHISSSMK